MNGKDLLDKGCRNDNTGSKVSSEEIHINIDSNPWNSSSDDREESCRGWDDENHEECWDAGTQAAIVFVFSSKDVANYLCWISGVKIDICRIKIQRHCRGKGCYIVVNEQLKVERKWMGMWEGLYYWGMKNKYLDGHARNSQPCSFQTSIPLCGKDFLHFFVYASLSSQSRGSIPYMT